MIETSQWVDVCLIVEKINSYMNVPYCYTCMCIMVLMTSISVYEDIVKAVAWAV